MTKGSIVYIVKTVNGRIIKVFGNEDKLQKFVATVPVKTVIEEWEVS